MADARACAEACETLLEAVRGAEDSQRVVHALVAPAAIARVLVELLDEPPELMLAACRLCRESARDAIGALESLAVDATSAIPALRASADSCERLLAALS